MRGRATAFVAGQVHDGGQTVGAAAGSPVGERARAARTVAAMSGSAEECAALLSMLGLSVQDALSSGLASRSAASATSTGTTAATRRPREVM